MSRRQPEERCERKTQNRQDPRSIGVTKPPILKNPPPPEAG